MSQTATALTLRPYQQKSVDALRAAYAGGSRRPLLVLPTGGGKTVIFAAITAGARTKGKRVLIVAHRRELIRQASAKLGATGVPHGIICPGFAPAPDELVQVASVQTLTRRLDRLPPFDLIVLDEAHHAVAGQWHQMLQSQPGAKVLGVTATPARLDGKGLGTEAGGPFDHIEIGPSIAELVDLGFLAPGRYFVPAKRLDLSGVPTRGGDYVASALSSTVDKYAVISEAVDQYRQRADHLPAIAFCVTVAHAEHVADAFRDAGYCAKAVSGETPKTQRDAAISGLGTGEVEILCACDLISEGLDVPAVGAVILLRPTKSVVLHLQQIGRGMRPAPGKERLIVLDHVGNVLVHGLPEEEREWSLAGVEKHKHGGGSIPQQWRCEACGCANPTAAPACIECGEPKPIARIIEERAGELAELTAQKLAAARRWSFREMASRPRTEPELREFARSRGYKPGWVQHRMREQTAGVAA